jgi:hypothetical protein
MHNLRIPLKGLLLMAEQTTLLHHASGISPRQESLAASMSPVGTVLSAFWPVLSCFGR